MAKFLQVIFIAALITGAILGVRSYVEQKMTDIDQAPLKTDLDIYTVKKGATAYTILTDLSAHPEHRLLYRIWLRYHPEFRDFKAGTYSLENASNLTEALTLLKSARELSFKFTIVEGTRFDQVKDNLIRQKHLNQDLSDEVLAGMFPEYKDNPEGLLMADTYSYTIGDKASDIFKRAHSDLMRYLDSEWQQRDEGLPYKTSYEALIMASIVEKETALEEEYPLIAAVFCNRLKINMKLQTDPTVIYGRRLTFDGNIRKSDLKEENPYNTYVIDGLPPTPIAIASRKAIHAVLHPSQVPFLYFVATGNGGHKFSRNYREHSRAVGEYLRNLRKNRLEQKLNRKDVIKKTSKPEQKE